MAARRSGTRNGLVLLLAGLLLLPPMSSATPASAERRSGSGSDAAGDTASTSQRQGYLVHYDRGRVAPRAGAAAAGMASARAADIIAERTDGRVIRRLERRDVVVAELNPDEAAELRKDPGVLSVTPERTVTTLLDEALPVVRADDTSLASLMPLANPVDGTGTAIVVIDNGVERGHPFFADPAGSSRVIDEVCFSSTGDCPNNSTTMTGIGAAAPLQGSSHGTHVAGIAAGRQDVGTPRRGVAGGAELLAAQVFGVYPAGGGRTEQRATTGDLLAALDWTVEQATTRPVRAVNLSVGGGLYAGDCDDRADSAVFLQVVDELRSLGALTIAASGNSGATSGHSWPACLSNVVSVTATGNDAVIAPFSNVSTATDVAAPGFPVTSSIAGGAFDAAQGTSMAVSVVSGAAALLGQLAPEADAVDLEAAIRATQTRIDDTRTPGSVTGIALLDVVTAASTLAEPEPEIGPPTAAPTLSLTGGDLSVRLTWAPIARASEYEVYRSQGESCSASSPSIGSTSRLQLDDAALSHGTTYRYCVRGRNSDGTGPVSASRTHTATDLSAPSAPTMGVVTRTTDSISLSWPAVSDPTLPITYRVYRSTSSSCSNSDTRVYAGTSRSVTDTGLRSATTYRYCATATDGAGNRSPLSNQVSATTSSVDPSAPRFPAAAVLSYDITAIGDLALSWPAASGTGQLRYEVHRDGSRITTTTGRSLTVTGLRTGRDYRFEVRALDSSGQRSDPIERTLTPATGFRDSRTSIFRRDIEWLATGRITRGCNPPTNDRFCPADAVTRGQMAAFLVRALGLSETSGVRFSDVPRNSTFEQDIDRLATAGITRGCNPPSNDRFCPSDPVTREQMAAFLSRGLELRDTSGVRFSDVRPRSLFSRDIDRLATAGITRGCNPPTNDRFCPRDPVTRGQMAAFLRRGLT